MDITKIIEVLAMSGYGAYVWWAFSVTLITLLGLFLSTRRRLKKALFEQRKLSSENNNEAS